MAAPIAAAVGTTSTQLLPANSARTAVFIQNPSNSGVTIWVSLDAGAAVMAPPCIEIAPGGYFAERCLGPVNAIATAPVTVTVGER